MGTAIYVHSLDLKLIQYFASTRRAGEYFNSSHRTINKYAQSGKIFKVKYILSFKCLEKSA
jgi:hypothetical protein